MTTVEKALSDYVRRVDLAPLRKYPIVWAGHYDQHGLQLGEYGVPVIPDRGLAHVCLGVMIPFGLTDQIAASFLVVDALRAPFTETYFETSRVLYVSSLQVTGDRGRGGFTRANRSIGIMATHWTVPLLHHQRPFYGPAEKTWSLVPGLDGALSEIMNHRLAGPTADFQTAYDAVMVVMEETFG